MADLPHTICSKVTTDLRDWLRSLARKHHRKLSDVIRILLEQVMEAERKRLKAEEVEDRL